MVYLHPFDRLRLQRGAEHLHRLGARPTAEFLAEVGHRIGGMPAIFALLGEYEERTFAPPVAPHRRRSVSTSLVARGAAVMSAVLAASVHQANDDAHPRHVPADAETLAWNRAREAEWHAAPVALEVMLRELASTVFNELSTAARHRH